MEGSGVATFCSSSRVLFFAIKSTKNVKTSSIFSLFSSSEHRALEKRGIESLTLKEGETRESKERSGAIVVVAIISGSRSTSLSEKKNMKLKKTLSFSSFLLGTPRLPAPSPEPRPARELLPTRSLAPSLRRRPERVRVPVPLDDLGLLGPSPGGARRGEPGL